MALRSLRTAALPAGLLLFALACGPGTGAAGLPTAPATVEPLVYDFGRIPFGQVRTGSYRVRNVGREPLELVQVGPAPCDCAGLELEFPARPEAQRRLRVDPNGMQVPLAAGEELLVHLELNTARYREPISRKRGAFVLRFAGYEGLRLEYESDIWNPHWVEPWALNLGNVGVRQRASGYVMVRGHDETDFQLLAPAEVNGWSLAVSRVGSADGIATYRVDVTAPAELPQGGFQQEFVLRSDLPESPPIKFTAQGVAEADIAWTPKRLLFAGADRPRTAELVLRALPAQLELAPPAARLRGASDGLTAAVEAVEPGRTYRVRLTLAAPPPAQAEQAELHLATGYPEQPEIVVPISILPPPPAQNP